MRPRIRSSVRRQLFGLALLCLWLGAPLLVGAGMLTYWLLRGDGTTPVNYASVYIVDGDTIDIEHVRWRLLGFDTPELYSARCEEEARLAVRAALRLQDLLQSGRITIAHEGTRQKDRSGRELGRLRVAGVDVGATLISEGLARACAGPGCRRPWCPTASASSDLPTSSRP